MFDITITLTDAEMKALRYSMLDPAAYASRHMMELARSAMSEIYMNEMSLAESMNIMFDKSQNIEDVVINADVKTFEERMQEM